MTTPPPRATLKLEIDYVIGESHREYLPNSSGPAAIIRIFGVTREESLLHYPAENVMCRDYMWDEELIEYVLGFFKPKNMRIDVVSKSFDSEEPGDRVEVDEPIAQIETDKVTIDVVSLEAGVITKLLAKEGETVEPGVKIVVISKSGEGAPQVAPLEQPASQPSPPKKQESVEKQTPKAETALVQ